MRTSLLLLLFTFISFGTFAQWEQRADPIFTKDHGIGFSLEGNGYVLTGGKNGEVFTATKDFFKYDPITDTWEQLTDYPGPARGYGIGDTYNGKLYFGFGLDISGNYMDDLWEWDPVGNVFTELPSCPCDGRVHPALVAENGKVYMGAGGNSLGNLNDWWIYDIDLQTWTQKSNMPGKRHHPYQFSIDGEIYVGNGHQSTWHKFDETNDSWISVASLSKRVAGSQFSYDGKGYSLSGADNNHDVFDTGEFWEYDPVLDSWKALPPHPGTSRFAPTQFVIDNYIYLLAGYYRMNGFLFPEETMYRYQLDRTVVSVESNSVNQFELYPNPAESEMNILSQEIISIVSIYDIAGKLVLQSSDSQVDISKIQPGLYNVFVRFENGVKSFQKLVKE